jgi:hypothetical protein
MYEMPFALSTTRIALKKAESIGFGDLSCFITSAILTKWTLQTLKPFLDFIHQAA